MAKTVKGVFYNPNKNEAPRAYELKVNSYKDYYPLLECDTFDIQTRKFKDEWLDIFCDDEGLFKENAVAIRTYDSGHVVERIVGSVFIVNHDEEGNTISLTDEQIKKVLESFKLNSYGEGVLVAEV